MFPALGIGYMFPALGIDYMFPALGIGCMFPALCTSYYVFHVFGTNGMFCHV